MAFILIHVVLRIMISGTRVGGRGLAALLSALIGAAPVPAISAPWEFETIVDVGVIYTDNLTLAEEGQEESEFVYVVFANFHTIYRWRSAGSQSGLSSGSIVLSR